MYKKVDKDIIERLIAIAGEKNVITDEEKMADYTQR